MSFKQLHSEGAAARITDKKIRDNPFYRSENLPAETAASYRAWQMKAEAWEFGWRIQDAALAKRNLASRRQSSTGVAGDKATIGANSVADRRCQIIPIGC